MAVTNSRPLVPIAGASDREGRSRRNRHHWIAPSRGIIPIVFFLIIAAPKALGPRASTQLLQQHPFSGSLLNSNANPIQADDGSDRGPAQGLTRWAKASVGSGDRKGDRRRRASCARGPSPTSFGVLGLTRARQSILARQQGRLARQDLGKIGRGRFCGARHTPRHAPRPLSLTHARAFTGIVLLDFPPPT